MVRSILNLVVMSCVYDEYHRYCHVMNLVPTLHLMPPPLPLPSLLVCALFVFSRHCHYAARRLAQQPISFAVSLPYFEQLMPVRSSALSPAVGSEVV